MGKNENSDPASQDLTNLERKGFFRTLLSFFGWTIVILYFLALGALLAFRLYAIPYLEKSKPLIEEKVTELIGMPFSIGSLKGGWDFITPIITLENIQLGEVSPLKIKQAVLVPSYLSIAKLSPIFRMISITEPEISIERTGNLQFNILGKTIELDGIKSSGDSSSFDLDELDPLFQQGAISINSGNINYTDKTKEQSLKIEDITFVMDNSLLTKKAALKFIPPKEIASPVTLQAEFELPSLVSPGVADWNEQLFLSVSEVNFGELAKWAPDFNISYKGIGSGDLWLALDKWKPSSATFIGALSDVNLVFDKKLPPLTLNFFKGKLSGEIKDHYYKVSTDRVEFEMASGLKAPSFTASLALTTNAENTITGGQITADRLDIQGFAAAFPSLPIPEEFKKFIIDRKLAGKLKNVVVDWSGDSAMPSKYKANVNFENLSSLSYVAPKDKESLWIPGIKNLSGSIQAENGTGQLTLNSTNTDIALPGLFAVASFHFDELAANGSWDINDKIKFKIDKLVLENKDLAFQGNGDYDSTKGEYGFLNANGTLSRGTVASVWRHVPLIAGKETVEWLRYGLLGGSITNAVLEFTGPLHEFPYKDSTLHKFAVTGNFKDGVIDFYPIKFDKPSAKNVPGAIWPTVTGVGGTIFFHGDGLRADVTEGTYQKVKLNKAIVEIPSYEAETVLLTVDASANGPLPSYLNYVNTSPIKGYTADIFGKAKATGDGALTLELTVPLSGPGDVLVNGSFGVNGAAINFNQYQIPDLTDVSGKVFFSEKGANAQDLIAKTWGETVTVGLNTNDKGAFEVNASGIIPAQALKQVIPVESLAALSTKYLSGLAPFALKGEITSNKVNIHVDSSLDGLAVKLPAPFNKPANKKEPLAFDLTTSKDTSNIALTLGTLLDTKILLKNDALAAAVISNSKAPALPKEGLTIDFSAPEVSVAQWSEVLSSLSKQDKKDEKKGGQANVVTIPTLNSIRLNVGKLLIDNFNQENFHLVGNQTATGWQAHLESKELSGDLDWHKARNGKEAELQAYLSKLYIPASAGNFAEETKPVEVAGGWPAINAVIQQFAYGNKNLGKVELKARNTISRQGHLWQIQKLNVINNDATLYSSGSWLKGFDSQNTTTLLLDTKISNLGRLLERLGAGRVIRRGNGSIKGELSWEGSPIGYNANTFDGKLNIDLKRGEILKIEPGAAKLLTLLSLQSLTRYLRLDFRDFYSKGFNFDSIIGSTNMNNGLMRLNDLTMVGSGATVVMKGDINVRNETENLHILVLPDINATGASIALAIANPIAGIGSFLAQLIFKDPLSKLFSFEYSVTGTWSDPVVKKLEKHDPF